MDFNPSWGVSNAGLKSSHGNSISKAAQPQSAYVFELKSLFKLFPLYALKNLDIVFAQT